MNTKMHEPRDKGTCGLWSELTIETLKKNLTVQNGLGAPALFLQDATCEWLIQYNIDTLEQD